jgi:hypothetical protein
MMLVSANARTVVKGGAIEFHGLKVSCVLVENRKRARAPGSKGRTSRRLDTLGLRVVQNLSGRGFGKTFDDLVDSFGDAHNGYSAFLTLKVYLRSRQISFRKQITRVWHLLNCQTIYLCKFPRFVREHDPTSAK